MPRLFYKQHEYSLAKHVPRPFINNYSRVSKCILTSTGKIALGQYRMTRYQGIRICGLSQTCFTDSVTSETLSLVFVILDDHVGETLDDSPTTCSIVIIHWYTQ